MKNIKKNVIIKSKVKLKDNKETPFNIDLNYSEEYDSFIIRVKKGEGFMSYTDSLQGLPLEVVQKLNEMLEEVLVKAGSEYEKNEHKMFDGGKVDSKLTESEVEKIAEATAKALGSKFSVTKGTVDNGSFDLDYDGLKYDGGSYIVLENGDVKNVAMPKKPIVYNYKTKKKYEFGGNFQSGVYEWGGRFQTPKTADELIKDGYGIYEAFESYKDAEDSCNMEDLSSGKVIIVRINNSFCLAEKRKNYADGGYFDGSIPKVSTYMTNYAKGGSLQAHGIEVGDTFVKTIMGGIQKVKDKNGKIVYINLSTGERDSQPPLPFDKGGKVSEDLFENYNKQPKKLAEIVENYMSKFDEGDYDYQDSKNFLKEVEAVGYTFDFGLDNEPYGLRPIGTKLKGFENGGGIGIEEDIDMSDDNKMRVRKPTMPEKKLTKQEWAEKHNAGAYEFMGNTKMATGGGVERINEGDKVIYKNNVYLVSKIQTRNSQGIYDVQYHLYPLKRNVEAVVVDNSKFIKKFATGGGVGLVGNQKRIDLNKNGKIDAEDFKLLRSSMNGAWRNERKHVNHNEDYEVRYAKPRPNRTGYKGKRKFGDGGGISNFEIGDNVTIIKAFPNADMTGKKGKVVELTKNNTGVIYISVDGKRMAVLPEYISKSKKFAEGGGISNFERLSRVVAKNYEGKRVKPQYQKEYGKVYSKSEAKEVGNKVAGKVKLMKKAESGAEVKKGNRGGVMVLAKQIRKEGESWNDAMKRASQQLK